MRAMLRNSRQPPAPACHHLKNPGFNISGWMVGWFSHNFLGTKKRQENLKSLKSRLMCSSRTEGLKHLKHWKHSWVAVELVGVFLLLRQGHGSDHYIRPRRQVCQVCQAAEELLTVSVKPFQIQMP